MPSIRQCLIQSGLARLEIRMLLEFVLGKPRAWLLAHDDEFLTIAQYNQFRELVQRRIDGEPMAYLVGRRGFMDFELQVTPDVLIPRPETELLVQRALDELDANTEIASPAVIDLGTGSGAIAIAIALARPRARVIATDVSVDAINVARSNAKALQAKVEFLCGNWFEPIPRGEIFDVVVSNPPYIHAQDEHLLQGDLRFEPRQALTDGQDGLAAISEIVKGSRNWLKPGGCLWLEHGYDQGHSVRGLLRQSGYSQIETMRDLSGHERISGGVFQARSISANPT